jgi:hypothetical protein
VSFPGVPGGRLSAWAWSWRVRGSAGLVAVGAGDTGPSPQSLVTTTPGSFILLQFGDAAIPDVIYIDTMAGELFLEEVADVRRYKLVFEHLRAVAASPEASLSLVTSGITGR